MMGSKFRNWEGEGAEEGRNANVREFESLSNLNTLEISINTSVLIPKLSIFCKLKTYKVITEVIGRHRYFPSYDIGKKQLFISASTPIPSDCGGIDWLLRSSDCLVFGEGCNDMVRKLLVEGLQHLKLLELYGCDTPKCLCQPPNAPATLVFPIMKILCLTQLPNLREICRGLVPAGSFGDLTSISIQQCGRLVNLFQLPIVGCLRQLKTLNLSCCDMMREVIWKEQREDVNVVTNRIELPKLESLKLEKLPSLVGFCRGFNEIDFPQLKFLRLEDLGQFNHLFHNNSNLSSNPEQKDNVGFLSVFPQKVTFPS